MSAKPSLPPPTFDPQPLIERAGDTLRAVARELGIDPAVLCRRLSTNQADRYATKLGLHPGEVWGADWYRPHRRQ